VVFGRREREGLASETMATTTPSETGGRAGMAGRRGHDDATGHWLTIGTTQAIGAAPDALRMQRVVNFYEKLPRGPAPQVKATGLLGRYQARYFAGKNASATRMLNPVRRSGGVCC